jgi:hypothetical protein
MPPRQEHLGERVSSIEATLEGLEKYEHERWHRLSNDLQPLMQMPERLAREVGKMQGIFDGKINSVSKEIERSIMAAIEKAIQPMGAEIAELRGEVETLKNEQRQMTGARRLGVWLLQTIIAALSAIVAVLALGRHP